MPDIETLVPRQLLTAELEADLSAVMKEVIGGHPDVQLPPNIIWPYFIGCGGSEHVTVRWYVHDFPERIRDMRYHAHYHERHNRTPEWVVDRSFALAPAIGAVLKKHGAPVGTCVSVDGFLLPRQGSALFEIMPEGV